MFELSGVIIGPVLALLVLVLVCNDHSCSLLQSFDLSMLALLVLVLVCNDGMRRPDNRVSGRVINDDDNDDDDIGILGVISVNSVDGGLSVLALSVLELLVLVRKIKQIDIVIKKIKIFLGTIIIDPHLT